jgi:hypothetical protein
MPLASNSNRKVISRLGGNIGGGTGTRRGEITAMTESTSSRAVNAGTSRGSRYSNSRSAPRRSVTMPFLSGERMVISPSDRLPMVPSRTKSASKARPTQTRRAFAERHPSNKRNASCGVIMHSSLSFLAPAWHQLGRSPSPTKKRRNQTTPPPLRILPPNQLQPDECCHRHICLLGDGFESGHLLGGYLDVRFNFAHGHRLYTRLVTGQSERGSNPVTAAFGCGFSFRALSGRQCLGFRIALNTWMMSDMSAKIRSR